MEEAEASFSRCLFFSKGGEGTQEAPGDDKEEVEAGSLPVKSIAIDGTLVDFRGFVFPGDAWFDSATFSGDARFDSATFSGRRLVRPRHLLGRRLGSTAPPSRAPLAPLLGPGSDSATFSGDARFDSATFSGDAWFDSATFSGDAWFDRATFSGDARFDSATFSGDARFDSATFTKSTSFRDAKFGAEEKKADADFTAIKVERAFDLSGASFSRVPSFCQADFKQAPDLDGVDFPLPPAGPLTSGDKDLVPKYRAIRRMAIQSADYDREQRAFKGEMRSRRWKIDKFWHPEGFFGWCYDWAADCGRSIIRPFAIWLLSVFVFAVLYLPAGKNALGSLRVERRLDLLEIAVHIGSQCLGAIERRQG